MCNFASFICTKDGNVYHLQNSNAHEDIIEKFGLIDDTNDLKLMTFARVEITPKNDIFSQNKQDWILKIDQEITPAWWGLYYEEKCWFEWEKLFGTQIFVNTDTGELRNRIMYLKNSRATLRENSQATLWGNSQATLWGNSIAKQNGNGKIIQNDNSIVINSYNETISISNNFRVERF